MGTPARAHGALLLGRLCEKAEGGGAERERRQALQQQQPPPAAHAVEPVGRAHDEARARAREQPADRGGARKVRERLRRDEHAEADVRRMHAT
eukprot:4846249-Pleurochrysis_carterae.AAC.2